MKLLNETTTNGLTQRDVTVGDVPCIIWSADGALTDRPLVLIAHGGGQHKAAPPVTGRALRYVACGFAVAAIDAPGHGDRPRTAEDEVFTADLRARMAAGKPVAAHVTGYNMRIAERAVVDWQAALDALQRVGIGTAGVGIYGASMGGAIGVALAAAEPRITAAVLGLVGSESVGDAASRVAVPVEFLMQWDDEIIARESALAVYDAFASVEKSLHVNPGRHGEVPLFEVASSERFFLRHLAAPA